MAIHNFDLPMSISSLSNILYIYIIHTHIWLWDSPFAFHIFKSRTSLPAISHLKTYFSYVFTQDQCNNSSLFFYVCKPTKVEHNFSLSIVTIFLSISVGFWFPWIFLSLRGLSSKGDRMKWYFILICFVLAWKDKFSAECITLWPLE